MQCSCPLRHSLVRSHDLQGLLHCLRFKGPGGLQLVITLLREIPIEVGKKTESQFVLTDGPLVRARYRRAIIPSRHWWLGKRNAW